MTLRKSWYCRYSFQESLTRILRVKDRMMLIDIAAQVSITADSLFYHFFDKPSDPTNLPDV